MYTTIVFLPFLAAILSGFFGRSLGVRGVHIINIICLLITTFLSFIAFYEVILCNSPVSIELFSWISIESFKISWSFYFDELTVSMLIPVLIVSLLVHFYSVGYMGEDPHQQRFFSYISLFTGLMLVLVSGNNFLVMFLGWEGRYTCLIWYSNIFHYSLFPLCSSGFSNNRIKIIKSNRIGPHNDDIISLIVGSILGYTQLEKRNNEKGTRVIFEWHSKNVEYLMWFHKYLFNRGYCSKKKPILKKQIKEKGKIFFYSKINTYTFSTLNWLHDMFYKFNLIDNKYKKTIPLLLGDYLSPLALAIWFMNNGSSYKCRYSIRIKITIPYPYKEDEIQFLCKLLTMKYGIISSSLKINNNKGYCIYIHKDSSSRFLRTIRPHLLPSFFSKVKGY
jgi:LAGLIDADG DNA endonuclease family/NADH-Ubiquinone oxidoreductase (complex I), chain 5 N-terminus